MRHLVFSRSSHTYWLHIASQLACILITLLAYDVHAIDRITKKDGFNGPVNAISEPDSNGIRYIGGDFTSFGEWETGGGGVIKSNSDGEVNPTFPKVNGEVFAVVADGSGGFFIGGAFTSVDGQPRNNAAHIAADGSVNPWNPNPNASVRAMARVNSTVYLGGGFTKLGAIDRNYVAAVNVNGAIDETWIAATNGRVYALEIVGSTVYLGGDFTEVNGTPRSHIAAVTVGGELNPDWSPQVNDSVYAISSGVISPSGGGGTSTTLIYFGGLFTQVDGTTRNHAAAVDIDGTLSVWNPNVNGTVYALQGYNRLGSGESGVFIGGDFSQVGGVTRNNLAAWHLNYYGPEPSQELSQFFNPNPDGPIFTIEVQGGSIEPNLFVGGNFETIGGSSRKNVASISTFDEMVPSTISWWRPEANGPVRALSIEALSQPGAYIGGSFTALRAELRPFAAAINQDGSLYCCWKPTLDGVGGVDAILLSEGTIFLGGRFSSVNNAPRTGVAAINSMGFLSESFNPEVSGGTIESIAAIGERIYLGGSFNQIDTYLRKGLVSLFRINGRVDFLWDAQVEGTRVSALATSGTTLYLGGLFNSVKGSLRSNLAAITTTGELTSWAPNADGQVLSLALSGPTVYLGGNFSTVANEARSRAAAVGTDGILSEQWQPACDASVRAIQISDSEVYLGGDFTEVNGSNRNFTAAVSPTGTLDSEWRPNLNNRVNALSASDSIIFAGGLFTRGGDSPADYLTILDLTGGASIPTLTPTSTPTESPTWTPSPTATSTPTSSPLPTITPSFIVTPLPVPRPARPVVNWSANSTSHVVRAIVTRVRGVSYSISGTSRGVEKRGRCKSNSNSRQLLCSIRLSRGTWIAAVTPTRQGVTGRAARHRFTFAR
jgi:hypothetical protein